MDTEAIKQALLLPEVVDVFASSLADKLFPQFNAILDSFMKDVGAKITAVTDRVVELEKQTTALKSLKSNDGLEKRIAELERYSRQDNLIIHGLNYASTAETASVGQLLDDSEVQFNFNLEADKSNLQTEEVVIKLLTQTLGLQVNRNDISVAHRLPKPKSKPQPSSASGGSSATANSVAPIIVKFNSKRVRLNVLKSRYKLAAKNEKPKIYINEHLTSKDSQIFAQARKFLNARKINKCWTFNGVTFIKMTDSKSEKPSKIENLSDFASHKLILD